MMATIRRFWYIPAIIILLALFLWQRNCSNNNLDNYIAEMAKNKVISAELAKQKGISNYYIVENAKMDLRLSDTIMQADMNSAEATAWHKKSVAAQTEIKKLKTCPEQLVSTTRLLGNCNDYVLQLNKNYTANIDDLNFLWGSKVKLKDREISDLNELHGKLIATHGETVKDLVIARLKGKQRVSVGLFAGYDPFNKRFVAGLGITFDIIRLPISLF